MLNLPQHRPADRLACRARWAAALVIVGSMLLPGCGTTRMSDTSRTATEQLLLSSAIDRAVNGMNFENLSGRDIYFDPQYLKGTVDENYVISSIRQALLANGCFLKEKREDAEYVVEARAGAVGTNRHELLVGVPQTTLPSMATLGGAPNVIPEIPFAKSTDQFGVAKLAVYAYNRETGQPVWQSGAFPITSTSKNSWVLGTGPFQKGTIYDGPRFAGSRIRAPWAKSEITTEGPPRSTSVPITAEVVFPERPPVARAGKKSSEVNLTGGESSVPPESVSPPQAMVLPGSPTDYAPPGFPSTSDPLGAQWSVQQGAPPGGQVLRLPAIDRPDRMDADYDEFSILPRPHGRLLERLFEVPNTATPTEESGGIGSLFRGSWLK